jgi:hypothetical protein
MLSSRNVFFAAVLGAFLFAGAHRASAQSQTAASTTIPVVFTHGVDASHARAGDVITAKTMQAIRLPNGPVIPKGATVLGHVADARPFTFDSTDYAVQQPSVLAIHFDKVLTKESEAKLVTAVRALAGWSDSESAMRPQATDEHDIVGTVYLIGGDSYRADERTVTTADDDIVGYHRKGGVFARLLDSEYSSPYSHFDCPGSGETEEAVSIFSPSACGLYGVSEAYLADNGLAKEPGTFRLESRKRTVKLYSHSAALLQILTTP